MAGLEETVAAQRREIEDLRARVEGLESQIEPLKSQNRTLMTQIHNLQAPLLIASNFIWRDGCRTLTAAHGEFSDFIAMKSIQHDMMSGLHQLPRDCINMIENIVLPPTFSAAIYTADFTGLVGILPIDYFMNSRAYKIFGDPTTPYEISDDEGKLLRFRNFFYAARYQDLSLVKFKSVCDIHPRFPTSSCVCKNFTIVNNFGNFRRSDQQWQSFLKIDSICGHLMTELSEEQLLCVGYKEIFVIDMVRAQRMTYCLSSPKRDHVNDFRLTTQFGDKTCLWINMNKLYLIDIREKNVKEVGRFEINGSSIGIVDNSVILCGSDGNSIITDPRNWLPASATAKSSQYIYQLERIR